MKKKYSVESSVRAVRANCSNPRPRCPLYDVFTPSPNFCVSGDMISGVKFVCNVILRGAEHEIRHELPRVKSLVQQVCQKCQDTRAAVLNKTR